MESYTEYKKNLLNELVAASGKTWNGKWGRTDKKVCHILPLRGTKNTRAARAEAIKKLLDFDCKPYFPNNLKGLHQYAHHLNSSQLLCLMFFSQLTQIVEGKLKATEKMVDFIKKSLHIDISVNADCSFEYTEDAEDFPQYHFNISGKQEYEGTSFDFHIKDGQTQIYFEIKFTEYGFGKVLKPNKDDDSRSKYERHLEKAKQYKKLLPELYKNKINTPEMLLENYQIFRNVIRAANENAYVIFITDGNNPKTKTEAENFEKLFGKVSNVQFITWQEIMQVYQENCELPFQLKAMSQPTK